MSVQSDNSSKDRLETASNKDRYLDGLDGVIFALSFATIVLLLTQKRVSDDFIVFFCFVPLMLRRWIFGQPKSYPLKPGFIWFFSSTFGLFLIFTSMVCFIFSWKAISDTYRQMPDYLTEIQHQEAQYQLKMQDINRTLNAVTTPVNTPPEEIKRLQDEKQKERLKKQKQRIQDKVQAEQEQFSQKQQKRFNDGLTFLIWGLLICLLGATLINARYDKTKSDT